MKQVKYGCESLPQQYTRFGRGQLPCDKNGIIHWTMLNWGQDIPKYLQIALIQSAFSEWASITYPIRFKPTQKESQAVWYVCWADDDDMITFPDGTQEPSKFKFRDHPDTIAVQYQSDPLLLIISDRWNYDPSSPGPNYVNLWETSVHEIGHGLQLGHSEDRKDVMYYQYIPGNRISKDSINGIYDFHGQQIMELAQKLPHSKQFISSLIGAHNQLQHNRGCNPFGIF